MRDQKCKIDGERGVWVGLGEGVGDVVGVVGQGG